MKNILITKDEYYSIMSSKLKGNFKKIHRNWYKCFKYFLVKLNVGYTEKAIKSLFYDFDMSNWEALHQENTEYKDFSKKKLLKSFRGECGYICDRMSYDRLFRTHWLFKIAFKKELLKLKYPDIKI